MSLLNKITYGFNQFLKNVFGITDYWHISLPYHQDSFCKESFVYYLNMLPKSFYPGEIKNGLPIFLIDGKYPIYFHITTLNYALGLLNRLEKGENVLIQIENILQWFVQNQNSRGGWDYNITDKSVVANLSGKPSGMTLGLAVSFIIRCNKLELISKKESFRVCSKAISLMLSDDVTARKKVNNVDLFYFEEWFNPGNGILNGSIFALLGFYDFTIHFNLKHEVFNKYCDSLEILLEQYVYHNIWSYYDLKGNISSKFYHELHIELLKVVYTISGSDIYKEYITKFEKGRKYSLFFTFIKAFQKLKTIKSMPMSKS